LIAALDSSHELISDITSNEKIKVGQWRLSHDGDGCPQCNAGSCAGHEGGNKAKPSAVLSKQSGIEVGHTFLLGQKYSRPFDVKFTNASGKPAIAEMGCYGLGVTRIIAALVESHNDQYVDFSFGLLMSIEII
jgi:hypothetical protein